MNTKAYLENLFNAFNEGRISAEAYDAAVINMSDFCDDDEDDDYLWGGEGD